jgi:hypothetical protein
MPEGYSSMNDGQSSFVLIMFDPAPDVLPFNSLMSLAPSQVVRNKRCCKRANFPEGCKQNKSSNMEMQNGGMFQSGGFGDGTISGPVEDIQAITGTVPPFGV